MGVVESLAEKAILGRNFLEEHKAIIDCANHCISINGVTSQRIISEHRELNKILTNFETKFAEMGKKWSGSDVLKPMKITLKEECKPIRCKPNRYFSQKRKILNEFVRLCVWFRHINKLVVRNHHPLSNPIHLVHMMAGNNTFTKIDQWDLLTRHKNSSKK
eukprot:TRINITY_DN2950_c0_g1_i19.p2 TRINITY_DN2950_c0_g1~~TRINITY_DN2950_c0_g1_i19.p2  ORF type:complete len:161 (+),score=15.33 TRINITY_DN2950_c0_g1_i19:734-1216(+)